MKRYLLTILFCLLVSGIFCQTQWKPLQVGDTLPDMSFLLTKNNLPMTTYLRQLGKKGLLIINFWNTWCGSCVKEIPILDEIVDQYGLVNVLAITYENPDKVNKFLRRNPKVKTSHLHMQFADSTLMKWFPHRTVPHNIWVDSNAVIRSITGYEYMREENVAKFLANNSIAFRQKKEGITYDEFSTTINDSGFLYRSVFTPYAENRHSTNTYLPGKYFGAYNSGLMNMYWAAYTFNRSFITNWSCVELKVRDSLRFVNPEKYPALFSRSKYRVGNTPEEAAQIWKEQNIFTYELNLRDSVSNEVMRNYIFDDLERFSGVEAKIIQRKLPCLVVTFDRKNYYALDRVPASKYPLCGIYVKRKILIKHDRLETLFNRINDYFGEGKIFVNETGITYPINLEIEQDANEPDLNFAGTIKLLESRGFRFTTAYRSHPVLVLIEKSRK